MRIKDARQTFMGIWFRRVVENGGIEVWGGDQKRDLTYVDDVANAFLAAGMAPDSVNGRSFNIGGSPPITLRDLAGTLIDIAGSGQVVFKEFPADRKRIDIGDYFADDRQFRAITGWAPQVELRDGIERTVAYYRKNFDAYV
jgi:UDP-glucose 4-epimerase